MNIIVPLCVYSRFVLERIVLKFLPHIVVFFVTVAMTLHVFCTCNSWLNLFRRILSLTLVSIIVGFPAISYSQTQQRMVNTKGKPQTSHLSGLLHVMIYSDTGCLTSRGLVPKHGWYNAQLVSLASAVGTPTALAIHFYTHMSPT